VNLTTSSLARIGETTACPQNSARVPAAHEQAGAGIRRGGLALTNIAKYAGASAAEVEATARPEG